MRRLGVRNKWRHHGVAENAPAFVHLIRGEWRVRCPFCPQWVPYDDRDRFLCPLCGNSAAGGRYAVVKAPPLELTRALRPLMLARPVENRNWLHGETIEEIIAENHAHGLAA